MINLGPLNLETVFGKVVVGIEHVSSISVQRGSSAHSGLLLHLDFDKDEGEAVSDRSGHMRHAVRSSGVTYVEGVPGKAIRTSSRSIFVRLGKDQFPVDGRWDTEAGHSGHI